MLRLMPFETALTENDKNNVQVKKAPQKICFLVCIVFLNDRFCPHHFLKAYLLKNSKIS